MKHVVHVWRAVILIARKIYSEIRVREPLGTRESRLKKIGYGRQLPRKMLARKFHKALGCLFLFSIHKTWNSGNS